MLKRQMRRLSAVLAFTFWFLLGLAGIIFTVGSVIGGFWGTRCIHFGEYEHIMFICGDDLTNLAQILASIAVFCGCICVALLSAKPLR